MCNSAIMNTLCTNMYKMKLSYFAIGILTGLITEQSNPVILTSFNPFSGEFIITMSHLPGRVLNFKNPPCPAILLRVQKKFEMCGISCHNNTKFLHAIAEVCSYLMHKKWNSHVYLEPDNTIGNFEVRITTFILTTYPLHIY